MKYVFSTTTITAIMQSLGLYEFRPWYQRGKAWFNSGRISLIENILRGRPFPTIFLHVRRNGQFDVFDGQQRLTAIEMFKDGNLRLSKGFSLNGNDYSDFTYQDLPHKLRKAFELHEVSICHCIGKQDEIVDLFRDLQKGQPLNAQEQRNAHNCAMREYIYDEVAPHGFFSTLIRVKKTRMNHPRVASEFVCLVEAGDYTSIRGNQINKMYARHQSSTTVSPIIKKTIKGLDIMLKAFPETIKNMPKNEMIAIFCMVMHLNNYYKLSAFRRHLEPWLKQFRIERKEATVTYKLEDPKLESAAHESYQFNWSQYNLATNNASSNDNSIKIRTEKMLKHFKEYRNINKYKVIPKYPSTW